MEKLMIGGIHIVENPHLIPHPKLQLDPDFEWIASEFRDQMNQWLLDMFGREATEPMFFIEAMNTLVTSPKGVRQLREAAIEQGEEELPRAISRQTIFTP